MPTVTVRRDKERPATLARWARRRKVPKSEVIRDLIDRAGLIDAGDGLIDWVEGASGRGLGLAQQER